LETSRDSSLGRQVYAEYEHLWRDATPIDLSPQFPTTIADANNALVHPLTDSELEILRLICNNFSNQEIAERKVVTLATVKKHINNLYSKLEIEDSSRTNRRAKAIRRAKELGLW
jgi:LuxR family transcriptional regulator, maltose regulon positive regulatory protein